MLFVFYGHLICLHLVGIHINLKSPQNLCFEVLQQYSYLELRSVFLGCEQEYYYKYLALLQNLYHFSKKVLHLIFKD